jgi:hypothetical protein
MASEYSERERKAGKFFLSELKRFMRIDAMGPLAPLPLDGQTSTLNQAYLTRAVYASVYDPASTAQDRQDPEVFASKMQSALGAGGPFLMKRLACICSRARNSTGSTEHFPGPGTPRAQPRSTKPPPKKRPPRRVSPNPRPTPARREPTPLPPPPCPRFCRCGRTETELLWLGHWPFKRYRARSTRSVPQTSR